jgi:hypothetical protein
LEKILVDGVLIVGLGIWGNVERATGAPGPTFSGFFSFETRLDRFVIRLDRFVIRFDRFAIRLI